VVDRQWRAYWEQRFDDPLSDAESLRMDDSGRITDIGNPVADIDEIQGQYLGLMRFRAGGIEALKTRRAGLGTPRRPWMKTRPIEQAYMTDLLMEMILSGHAVHAVPIDGGWLEIDTPRDLEQVAAMTGNGTINRFFDPGAKTRTA
jgi:choline kinase